MSQNPETFNVNPHGETAFAGVKGVGVETLARFCRTDTTFLRMMPLFQGKRDRFVVMNKRTTKALKSTAVPVGGERRVNEPLAEATESRQEEVARKLGARMRDLRLERQMSLAQMQKRGGLTPSQMSSVERGRVQVTLGTVVAVAKALEMPTFMVLLLPDEDSLSAVLEEIRQAYGGDWRRAAFVIAGALGIDLSKLLAE
jgi:transcriptional regulator with XRE-family HTH domain